MLDEVSASPLGADCVYYQNLTDSQEFAWHQFLAARPWGRDIVDDVVEFGAAWWIRGMFHQGAWNGPVFIATMSTHAREHARGFGVIKCNAEKAKISWLEVVRFHR